MSALFAFKLTLVPFFILALSLAGRRWGTAVSGWLVALPVVAGPIVFFIGMEHGEVFAAGAARATIAGLASLVAVYLLLPPVDSDSGASVSSWSCARGLGVPPVLGRVY